jgi:hypothetical protein
LCAARARNSLPLMSILLSSLGALMAAGLAAAFAFENYCGASARALR